jgi:excinuclease UvrABC nuclease subunit
MSIIRQSSALIWSEANIKKAPETCGVYTLRIGTTAGSSGYVGSAGAGRLRARVGSAGAGRLRARLLEHWTSRDHPRTRYFHWAQCTNTTNARSVEAQWIERYDPPWNK